MKKNEFKILLKEWMSNTGTSLSGCFHMFKGEDNSQKGRFIYIFCSNDEFNDISGSYLDDELVFNELSLNLNTSNFENSFNFIEHKKCMSNDPYCLRELPDYVFAEFKENLKDLSGCMSDDFRECLNELGCIFDSFYIIG